MAQKYKTSDDEYTFDDGSRVYYNLKKGVTIIHLFNEEWRIGRLNEKTGKKPHVVIYAPDDKLYHAYDEDALYIFDALDNHEDKGYKEPGVERGTVDRAAAKIWILTNILDDPDKWSFNPKIKPEKGRSVKVIYDNGTIKWVENFNGTWPTHQGRWKRQNRVVAWRKK